MNALTEAVSELSALLHEKAEPVGSELSWGDGDRHAPKTPWGPAQQGYVIDKEVIFYGTSGHGGLRVSKKAASKLTDAAKKFGESWGGAYWYEEDVALNIPFYEVELWRKNAAKWFKSLATETPESIRKIIARWQPEYLVLVDNDYKSPELPKVGETWVFTGGPLTYGKGFSFEKGDEIKIDKLTSGGLVFSTSKHSSRFRLRTVHLGMITKVEK
jgi:hypothetical protein